METILNMTRDLILAQVRQRAIDADGINDWLRTTHGTLLRLWLAEHQPAALPLLAGEPADWRKSIKNRHITCLICGDRYRQISIKHLATHALTLAEYRERFDIPRSQPLSARAVTARRREVMHRVKPWLKRGDVRRRK
jgi:predicted transcriptional regulator